jgi:hypothetical protein
MDAPFLPGLGLLLAKPIAVRVAPPPRISCRLLRKARHVLISRVLPRIVRSCTDQSPASGGPARTPKFVSAVFGEAGSSRHAVSDDDQCQHRRGAAYGGYHRQYPGQRRLDDRAGRRHLRLTTSGSGDLAFTQSVTINSTASAIINAHGASRVIEMVAGANPLSLTVSGVTLENGAVTGDVGGAGILMRDPRDLLVVTSSTIQGNTVTPDAGHLGGGIFSDGPVKRVNTNVLHNTAIYDGTAGGNGGGVWSGALQHACSGRLRRALLSAPVACRPSLPRARPRRYRHKASLPASADVSA